MSVVKKTATGKRFLEKVNTGADTGVVSGGKFVDGTAPADAVFTGGNVGIGIQPTEKLSVQGVIESKTGGIKFPDATVQTSAAAGGGKFVDGSTPADAVFTGGNVGIGEQPTETLSVAGIVKSSTGGFKFPDATVQTTAVVSGVGSTVDAIQTTYRDVNNKTITSNMLITDWQSPTKTFEDLTMQTGDVIAWSPDDSMVLVGVKWVNVPLRVYINNRDGTFTYDSDIPMVPASIAAIAWSPTGEFVAVTNSGTVNLRIFQRVQNDFIEVPTANIPQPIGGTSGTTSRYNLSWSVNDYLAVANSGGQPEWYSRSGIVFTKLTQPTPVTDLSGYCSWSPNGEFLAVSNYHAQGAFGTSVYVYQRSGTTLTQLPLIPTAGESRGKQVSWSIDSKLLYSRSINTSAGFSVWSRSGTAFTDITTNLTSVLAGAVATQASFHSNGRHVALLIKDNVPYLSVLDYTSGNVFTLKPVAPNLPVNPEYIEFSNDGRYLAYVTFSGIFFYKTSSVIEPSPSVVNLILHKDVGQKNTDGLSLGGRRASSGNIATKGQGVYGITDTSAPRTVTLSSGDALVSGTVITIKDESGLAGTNNITITTEGSETIDGISTKVLSTNYQSWKLYSNGTNWFSI